MQTRARSLMVVALAVAATACATSAHSADPNHPTIFPRLGIYGNFVSGLCGKKRVQTDLTTIPQVGCFAIKAGGSLPGEIEGRSVLIQVDNDGTEAFVVDGVPLQRTSSSSTNDPLIKPSSSGFAFCRAAPATDCPVMIDTLDRQRGAFASFDVSREFKPGSYVGNEENWEAEPRR